MPVFHLLSPGTELLAQIQPATPSEENPFQKKTGRGSFFFVDTLPPYGIMYMKVIERKELRNG